PFFRSTNSLDTVSGCLFLYGEACRRLGRLNDALMALPESLAICTRLDRRNAAEFSQVAIASTLRDMERYEQALETLESPLHTGDRMIKTRALLVAADIQRIKGHPDRAWSYLAEAVGIAQGLGSKSLMGIAHRLVAQTRAADTCKQLPPAHPPAPDIETSFVESIRLLRETHCDDELALTYLAYGQSLLADMRQTEAREALSQAYTLAQACGMVGLLTTVQELIN